MAALALAHRPNVHGVLQAAARASDDRGDRFTDGAVGLPGGTVGMDIEATKRTQDLFALRAQRNQGAGGAGAVQFAQVYELSEARRRRMTGPTRIPDEVWEAMDRASELADDLAARGQQVRFDTHRVSGGVVASLCDHEGTVLRRIGVSELVGSGPDLDPVTAA
jgi:hypothetical protein